ncbi:unnamed protein product [Debaryomyces tyrocola]|nr:unnamed protein product [Debaryomyces tyrocola]
MPEVAEEKSTWIQNFQS